MNNIKHFINSEDLTQDQHQEILKLAESFEKGQIDFSDYLKNKVLGMAFFEESLFTYSLFESAIIKMGGGTTGINGTQNTFIAQGIQGTEETLELYIYYCDGVIIRDKGDMDLKRFKDFSPSPLINGLCGKYEHATGGTMLLYTILKKLGKLNKLKIGFYGPVVSSRPIISYMKQLSMFGAECYVDTVVPTLKTPQEIIDFVNKGGKYIESKFDDLISDVDILLIPDPQPIDKKDIQDMEMLNNSFQTITNEVLKKLKHNAYMYYVGPTVMTNGKSTIGEGVTANPICINRQNYADSVWATMGILGYLMK